jgi:hypothetical protein
MTCQNVNNLYHWPNLELGSKTCINNKYMFNNDLKTRIVCRLDP